MDVDADAEYCRTHREASDDDDRGCKRPRTDSEPGLARFLATGHVLNSDNADAAAAEAEDGQRITETEVETVGLDGQLRREQEIAATLMREKEKTAKQEAFETIAGVLAQIRAGELTLEALVKTLQELQASYEQFKLCGFACRFVHPLLIRFFQGWEPLKNPSFGLEIMSSLKDLLQGDGLSDLYAQLVNEVILPAVRTSSWDATDPKQPMLCFLELWERLLPPTMLESILDHVVMPKLSAVVDSWNPREDKVPMHLWVQPWLPVLGQRTETLCHFIRHKLISSVFFQWQPHDAYAVLSPWKGVFDPPTWELFVVYNIIPKLRISLQKLEINTEDQNLHQFNSVMIWSSAIPAHHMEHMLEVDFFRKWHQALYKLLSSSNPDFNDIIKWYKVWKGLFPTELLENERIQTLLTTGLNIMYQAAKKLEVVHPEKRPAQQTSEDSSYHGAPGAAMVDLNFKESIQAYAMGHGLLVMPRVGKFYNGFQLYRFGTVSIYVDSVKGLPFAQLQKGNERWSSVSLTELLKMNQLAKSC